MRGRTKGWNKKRAGAKSGARGTERRITSEPWITLAIYLRPVSPCVRISPFFLLFFFFPSSFANLCSPLTQTREIDSYLSDFASERRGTSNSERMTNVVRFREHSVAANNVALLLPNFNYISDRSLTIKAINSFLSRLQDVYSVLLSMPELVTLSHLSRTFKNLPTPEFHLHTRHRSCK